MENERIEQEKSCSTEMPETQEVNTSENMTMQENDMLQNDFDVSSKKDNTRIKKAVVIIISVAIILAICAIVIVKLVIPSIKYNTALELAKAGSYDEAIAIYNEIGDYKDSNELVIKTTNMKTEAMLVDKIKKAQELYKSGEKVKAYRSLYEERNNKKVAEILEQYKADMLKEYEDKIFWEDDDMSDYHWAYSVKGKDAGAIIYLSQNKNDPSDITIFFTTAFISNLESYTFAPPVHPTTIRLRGENGNVDIDVSPFEREFSTLNGYNVSGWWEEVTVEITLEKAKEIVDVIGEAQKVKIRAIGASSKHDYEDSDPGFKDIVDYIELISLINGLI